MTQPATKEPEYHPRYIPPEDRKPTADVNVFQTPTDTEIPFVRLAFVPHGDGMIGSFIVRQGVTYQAVSDGHLYGNGRDLGVYSDSDFEEMRAGNIIQQDFSAYETPAPKEKGELFSPGGVAGGA